MNKSLIILSVVLGVIFIGISSLLYDPFSSCPMAFRFEYETKCWLRDERAGSKLIELFNASQDTVWLAQVSDNVIWLQHPIKLVPTYKNHIPENVIKFANDELSTLLVNGTEFPVTKLSERPAPGTNQSYFRESRLEKEPSGGSPCAAFARAARFTSVPIFFTAQVPPVARNLPVIIFTTKKSQGETKNRGLKLLLRIQRLTTFARDLWYQPSRLNICGVSLGTSGLRLPSTRYP